MRDIKFRAWSELDNKMYQCDMQEDIQDYFRHDDGITIEQYIGRKDKNKKDIYMGDLLKWDNDKTIYLVKWDNADLGYYAQSVDGTQSAWIDDSAQVIGNIHKNKELIK